MSLSQILDDIQGDASNVQVSTEHNAVTAPPTESTFKVPSTTLNKNVLSKFNTLYNTLTAKDTVYQLNKVDFKIAQEVFTMLPDISKTEQAKVTSYPSTVNKDILQGVLDNVSNTMPEEILDAFREILDQIRQSADAIVGVVDSVEVYAMVCKVAIERFNKQRPLVIVDKESRDLFQEDLFRCSYIDDTQLDYDKYANKLSHMFENLAKDPTLQTFLTYRSAPEEGEAVPRFPEISLSGLCEKIVHLSEVVKSERNHLENYAISLDAALTEEVKAVTANSSFLVNNANGVVDSLAFFKMLHDILDMDDQFFEKTKQLIDFLD